MKQLAANCLAITTIHANHVVNNHGFQQNKIGIGNDQTQWQIQKFKKGAADSATPTSAMPSFLQSAEHAQCSAITYTYGFLTCKL